MMGDTETELKLQMSGAAIARLRRLRWLHDLRLAPAITRRQSSVYFDTPEFRLRRAGVTLRIRTVGQRRLQTVKAVAEPGSLTRGEWERPTDRTLPDLAGLGDSPAATLLDGIAADDLRPVFRTDIRRTIYRLGGPDWQVEMVIDVGELVAGQSRMPVSEIELELRSGPPGRLFALADDIAARLPVRLSLESKAARGYALLEGAPSTPSKWRAPRLPESATVAQVFRATGQSCLAHLLANESCLQGTGDSEAVHQMRVALRRLRSLATVVGQALPTDATAAIAAEMKWLLGQLGPARDIDVFIARILAPVAARLPAEEGLQRLLGEFEARKERHYQEARSALASVRCTRLIIGIGAWIEGGATEAAGGMAATELARTVLTKRHHKVRRGGRDLARLAPEERHRLRIGVKKLRYAAEFFAGLFPGKRTRRYIAGLAELQDRLGDLNDVAVAAPLLRDNGGSGDSERTWAAGLVAGWHARRGGRLDRSAAKAWSDFTERAPFWR